MARNVFTISSLESSGALPKVGGSALSSTSSMEITPTRTPSLVMTFPLSRSEISSGISLGNQRMRFQREGQKGYESAFPLEVLIQPAIQQLGFPLKPHTLVSWWT